jgi:peroxiredoxin
MFKVLAVAALMMPAAAIAAEEGPMVGAQAPEIHATDLAGKSVDIAKLSAKKGVVLLFFRSAKWCPYCQAQLIAFRDAQAPLAARGYALAAVSYDPIEVLAKFREARDIKYALLSDMGSATIDAWQMRDPQYKPDSMAYGVPRPAIFVISKTGRIDAKLMMEGYKVRPSVDAVIAAVDGLGK